MGIYFGSINRLTYYIFALNLDYARWTIVQIYDMLLLPGMYPNANEHFQQDRFTVNKTGKLFSNIGLDICQEQNIKKFKHYSGPLSQNIEL